MNKKELLSLPTGNYLLTDSICNYKFLMKKFDVNEGLVCSIYDWFSYVSNFSPHISVFFEKNFDEQTSSLTCVSGIGSISIHADFYGELLNLNFIGKYCEDTMVEDLKIFKMHYKINSSRYYKKLIVK